MLKQRLVLRCEGEEVLAARIQEWLFAEAVAGAEQLVRVDIVKRKGEHAVEAIKTTCTPDLVGFEDDLGIGV